MTVNESKNLKKGTRVCWRGDAADSGIITETSWDAVTIAWNNGQVASVHHGDMREIERVPTKVQLVKEALSPDRIHLSETALSAGAVAPPPPTPSTTSPQTPTASPRPPPASCSPSPPLRPAVEGKPIEERDLSTR